MVPSVFIWIQELLLQVVPQNVLKLLVTLFIATLGNVLLVKRHRILELFGLIIAEQGLQENFIW